MDAAYILMIGVGVASFALALFGANNWFSVGLLSLSPLGLVATRMLGDNTNGVGESLLYLSPFLIGMVFLYGLLCLIGSALGRTVGRWLGLIK